MKTFVLLALLAVSACAKPSRIYGGHNAKRDGHPYLISLQIETYFLYTHICGGSIIRPDIVITAAHCMTGRPFILKAGLYNQHEDENVQTVNVSQIIVHENYLGGAGPNDIAILKLADNFEFNDHVQPIALPASNEEFVGDVTLSGWGATPVSAYVSETLQEVTLPIITDDVCANAIKELIGLVEPFFPDANICTGPLSGGVSSCDGDSGGPLVQDGKLVGIVTWGMVPCAKPGAPSIYTEVSHYVDWIQENLETLH